MPLVTVICEGALSDACEDFLHDENGETQNILIKLCLAPILGRVCAAFCTGKRKNIKWVLLDQSCLKPKISRQRGRTLPLAYFWVQREVLFFFFFIINPVAVKSQSNPVTESSGSTQVDAWIPMQSAIVGGGRF